MIKTAFLFIIFSLSYSLFANNLTDSNKDSLIIGKELTVQNTTVESLIDSLINTNNNQQKTQLALKIARELKNTNWKRCLKYIELAETNANKVNQPEFSINTFQKIADIYDSKDLLDISLKYYTKAYNLAKAEGYDDLMHGLENDIAITYARLNKYKQALSFFKRIYENQKKEHDTLGIAKVYNNMGLLYYDHNIDSSLHYFNKSLELAYQINNAELSAYVFTNIAKCYSIKNNEAKTDYYFKKSLSLIDSLDNDTKAWIYKTIASNLLSRDKLDSAIYFAKKSTEFMQNNEYTFNYLDVQKILFEAKIKKKSYKEASQYFLTYNKIRDSLNVVQKAINAEKIKLEQDFLLKTQQRNIEENNRRIKYLMIGFSLIVLLLILIILLSRYKSRLRQSIIEKELIAAKKKELDADLESKKQLLIAKAMKEIHRADFIQDILTDLKKIKLKAVKKETQEAINIILQRLEKGATDNMWDEFELSFEKVHEVFFKNLIAKHPDLTSKDKRLCALLVLNLTSKEIAQITGQDFKTVENARTRLRKKLNLTNTKTDLVTYLASFK